MGKMAASGDIHAIELALQQIEALIGFVRQSLTELQEPSGELRAPPPSPALPDNELARLSNEIFRFRRSRADYIPPALLGEPAWDILLDLFEKSVTNQTVSVTSACIAASVPGTTALRWLNILLDEGLIERHSHEADRRVSLVRLSETGRSYVRHCLSKYAAANAAEAKVS